MGKKRIIQKPQEELIKEREKIDAGLKKEVKTKAPAERTQEGKLFISSSYNNTIITLANMKGNVLAWKSAGSIGFKGTKKATSFAASKVGEAIANIAQKLGVEKIHIFVKGIGSGRESAVRSLLTHGLDVVSIEDITPVPHNGCRPRKVRRV